MQATEERSVWIYRLPYPAETRDIEVQISQGPDTAAAPPNVIRGEAERETVRSTSFGSQLERQNI